MTARSLLVAGALLAASCVSAHAQQTTPPAPAPSATPAKPVLTHAERVDELGRVLGRAHYLRLLCSDGQDQTWRNAMRSLMDLEAPAGSPRRTALVTLFNDGYRYEEERFPDCSPEAREANRALSAQGKRLADALAARFRQ